jgi:hypothetical protein
MPKTNVNTSGTGGQQAVSHHRRVQANTRRTGRSSDEAFNERFLWPGLHSACAVVVTDPSEGIVGRMSTEDCEAGQGGSGSSVPSEAAQLNPFSTASAF